MPFVVALVLLGLLLLALVVMVAREPGPTPEETAVAYEAAWDRLDFASVWEMSSTEMRDGRSREEFVAAKRAVFADRPQLDSLVGDVSVRDVMSEGQRVNVRTVFALPDSDGDTVEAGSNVTMERRDGRWQVVAYTYAGGDHEQTITDPELERWD